MVYGSEAGLVVYSSIAVLLVGFSLLRATLLLGGAAMVTLVYRLTRSSTKPVFLVMKGVHGKVGGAIIRRCVDVELKKGCFP